MSDFKESLKIEMGNMENIQVEKNTAKDYENYKKKRLERELQKPIWENKKLTPEQETQKKIFEDNLDELRC